MNMKNLYMYALGLFVVGASFAIVYMLIFHAIPPENKDIVNIAFGTLLGLSASVVNYFYGSSKSSADKNEMLREKPKQ